MSDLVIMVLIFIFDSRLLKADSHLFQINRQEHFINRVGLVNV